MDEEGREGKKDGAWYHEGVREKIRRWELSPLVKFGPRDKELRQKVESLALEAKARSEVLEKEGEGGIDEAVREVLRGKKETLWKLLSPGYWVGSHSLVDRFGEEPANCLDRSLMGHLVFEELGIKGSKVVGFISPDTGIPSFGLVRGERILTLEEIRWIETDKFKRVLRLKGKSDRLHNVYPPQSVREVVRDKLGLNRNGEDHRV